MRRLHAILITMALGAAAACAAVEPGKPAPDFAVKDIEGKTHRLSDYKGKIVVLEAYNLDCPFCANHYKSGAMQELQAAMTKQGVVWLVVNSTSKNNPGYRDAAKAKREFAQQGIKATAWIDDHDGTLGKLYAMKTTPHMFVIDQKGMLAYDGAIDDRAEADGDPRKAKNYVRTAVMNLKNGKAVDVARTKPYGCGVKYGS